MQSRQQIHTPFQIPYVALMLAAISCTDFQEKEIPVSFGVDVNQVDFPSAASSRSVTVSSGTMWDVTSLPRWITLQSIQRSMLSSYEWVVNFKADANEEYDREGTITIKSGTANSEIAVTQEGKKGKYVAVESVSLSHMDMNLTVGENATLAYTISPENVSVKDVTWKSSSPSVAKVSASGEIEAIDVGTAMITVTTADGGKTASCSVTVNAKVIPVESVSLDKTIITMTEGDTQTLTVTVIPDNATDKSVIWSSNNTSVATVSSSGVVTAKSAGDAIITVTTADCGKTTSCTVTVNAKDIPVESVSLDKTSITMTEGETQTLTAMVIPDNATDKSVVWSSSNTTVATVSTSGLVTAKTVGTAIITVTTNDGGKKASCSVIVKANIISVTGVSLNKTSLSLIIGDTERLTESVTPLNASNKNVTWLSSNSEIATVDSNGNVSAIKTGTAIITVTTEDGGKTAACSVSVNPPVAVTGINLDQTSLWMHVGDTQKLSATLSPSNATYKGMAWSSSNTDIVSVSIWGEITAKALGEATITVKAIDGGFTATCWVSVRHDKNKFLDIPFNNLILVNGMSYTMYEKNPDYVWSSDNPFIASVSTNGVITTYSAGHATITARSSGDREASCIVHVYNRDYRGFQAIDLGLPSGLKWASHNIGASKPEEYGGFFSWGETETYDANYIYSDKEGDHYCKYYSYYSQPYNDAPTLEPEDDAAHVKWGGSWRMPTWRDIDELIKFCSWEWSSVNGTEGYLVSSKTNGNSIFLPVGGKIVTDSIRNPQLGYYWTSTANDDGWGAHQLRIGPSFYFRDFGSSTMSSDGAAIRAVSY